ncbi:ketopantoate reductase family protein [Cyclobacterium qasimii]|uniref:2-dehydropantoate 2-reductase n=2 Tax=Cyclobacterium qasimii TaxID=1350429 RepID=S7VAI3_9BACT|nr:2-dehydropantoate 2-reductase N-terminal domain-containing protein [Cyclobacterium qasimii]EPR66971.1 2-dehydropantoate 2-reductase [Cyclobacterium qasimii M12-11B]GEO20222.1 2-dehydropantoate 2-reductase [Cyclobacterium qasimii]
MKKKSIAILGIGGVGGFIGAKILANRFDDSIKLDFISRGATYENIKSKGFLFTSPEEEVVLYPDDLLLSGKVEEPYDLVILATKSQSMESAIIENQSIFDENTLVLPLQNMVNAAQFASALVKKPEVVDACIYLISNVQNPGQIRHLGGPGKVIVGKPLSDKFDWAFEYLNQCGIPISLVSDAPTHLWRKFLFISSLGALSAAYDVTLGEIRNNPELKTLWEYLMEEIIQLAQNRDVPIDHSDLMAALEMLSNFPANAKTSFQLDIEKGWTGEKKTLVDEVISDSLKNGLTCPYYQEMEFKIDKRLQHMAGAWE